MGVSDFSADECGVLVAVGKDVVQQFILKDDMDLVVRAHQVVEDGYELFANRQLVTICSAPNYCGKLDVAVAIPTIDENLV